MVGCASPGAVIVAAPCLPPCKQQPNYIAFETHHTPSPTSLLCCRHRHVSACLTAAKAHVYRRASPHYIPAQLPDPRLDWSLSCLSAMPTAQASQVQGAVPEGSWAGANPVHNETGHDRHAACLPFKRSSKDGTQLRGHPPWLHGGGPGAVVAQSNACSSFCSCCADCPA